MASLMDTMIDVLYKEEEEYRRLIDLSNEKTTVIVQGDLDKLAQVTEKEQVIVERIQKYEKIRMQTSKDIAEVTNHDPSTMNLQELIRIMDTRPVEQAKLREVHDKLKETLSAMVKVNERNKELLKNSLEMVEFEMNLLNSMRRAPETGDYNKNAYSTGNIMGSGTKRFDASQ